MTSATITALSFEEIACVGGATTAPVVKVATKAFKGFAVADTFVKIAKIVYEAAHDAGEAIGRL